MQVIPGLRLAQYEVTAAIGKGGMGEVWRAKDTKLGREVAIKVLPDEFTRDAERLARFEREARILAALDHPNIASIFGLDDSGGVRFLAMQLAEGEDLAERLKRGPIPVDESLKIARQIADALDAAHEKGIVHRDLKPANVKIGTEGYVRVLDFGLAKAMDVDESDVDFSHSPTMLRPASHAGTILGTAAYMSPEQARGKRVGKRADLWAFGVLLFEMLTGERLFAGETVSDTLAEVLRGEIDWSRLPSATPPAVRRLLRRCLERDRKNRLADASDARLEIEEALRGETEPTTAAAPPVRRVPRLLVAGITAAAFTLGGITAWMAVERRPTAPVLDLEITGASFNAISPVAISPDGRRIAFVPYAPNADAPLCIRDLDDYSIREIPGTRMASYPFFSPDGKHIGFFSGSRELNVMSLTGGTPRKLIRVATYGESAAWTNDGRIIASGGEIDGARWRGLGIIPAAGGTMKALTTPSTRERAHAQPVIVPGGRWVLFTVVMTGNFAIDAVSLEDGRRHRVVESGSSPHYASSGHLVYFDSAEQTLLAVPFDPDEAAVTGDPVVVERDVLRLSGGQGAFALSGNGTLIYTPTSASSDLTGTYSLVWVDRKGQTSPIIDRKSTWTQPRISPDGTMLLVRETATPDCTLWTVDLARGTMTRQSFDGDFHAPAWQPDSRGFVSAVATGSYRQLNAKPLGAESRLKQLTNEKGDVTSGTYSRDGRYIAYQVGTTENSSDIYVVDAAGGEPRPFATTPFAEGLPAFSPDGRWIAYNSDESGRPEIYVKPFSGEGPKMQISTEGGTAPVWSRDGRELFFASRDRFMVVDVTPEPEFRVSSPRVLFTGRFVFDRPDNYDITPDGRKFAMIQSLSGEGVTEVVRVSVGWTEKLAKHFEK